MNKIQFNPLDRRGLLPKMMFDKDRVAQLRALTNFYRPDTRQDDIFEFSMNISDSYIPVPDFSVIPNMLTCSHKQSLGEHIRRCFLFFFKNVTYEDNGPEYIIHYGSRSCTIRTSIVNSFFHWQVYNDISSVLMVEKDDMEGSIRSPTLIPARNSANDGQMKIMVDAILTVDALECHDKLNILIVGSAHDPMIQARSSYDPLFQMVTNSTIDMYDFLEESGVSTTNSNTIRRYRKPYDYTTLSEYDVYIDDAWYQGTTPFESRLYNSVESKFLPANFSVKVFDEITSYNLYHQVSYTKAQEKRMVSRSVIPAYRENLRLGKCPFCVELKFFLTKKHYGDEFYKSIMRQHKTMGCCPVKWYREISSVQYLKHRFDPSWVKVADSDYVVSSSEFVIRTEQFPLRILPYSTLKNLNFVEPKESHLRDVAVVLDNVVQCTQVLKYARAIYYYDGSSLFQHIQDQQIPTKEVMNFVQRETENVRGQVQEVIGKRILEKRRYDTPVMPRDLDILPQERSLERSKEIKRVYREKINNLNS